MKKVVITGGHLTPALAVIDELIKQKGWEIFFIGRKYATEKEKTPSVESQIISEQGIWFIPINAGRFPRHLNRYTFISILKIPLGFFQAFYHLFRLRPQAILSFGGYVSLPVVFNGWLLGIPALTHEQTTVQGLASKINSLFARRIAVSWPQTIEKFPKEKVVYTGNPIRKEIFKINKKMWQVLRFPKEIPLVFVTGGNLGSHVINQAVESSLPRLVKRANVFHQCGHLRALGDFERLQEAREKLPPQLKKRYHVRKYLTGEEMGTLFNKADLIVCRAGANTLTEIAALGKPALVIPLPWLYQDEQTQNAQMLVKAGTAEILTQKDLSGGTLYQRIDTLIRNKGKYEKNASAAKKLVKLDAAKRIVKEVEKIV